MIDPRFHWDDDAHELLIWYDGAFRHRSDRSLPADMVERIDAAMRHVENPQEHPWPEETCRSKP